MFIRGPPAVLICHVSPCRRLSTGCGEKCTTARVRGLECITDSGG